MRYRLRTLMILLAVGPPALWGAWTLVMRVPIWEVYPGECDLSGVRWADGVEAAQVPRDRP